MPHHRVLKLFNNQCRPIPLTVPISCAATFFLPRVCIIIHLLKYVMLLFHLWAHTCTSAKPQLTPESYCRQRKHSVLLLSPRAVCLRLPHSLPAPKRESASDYVWSSSSLPATFQTHGSLFFSWNLALIQKELHCSLSKPLLIALMAATSTQWYSYSSCFMEFFLLVIIIYTLF